LLHDYRGSSVKRTLQGNVIRLRLNVFAQKGAFFSLLTGLKKKVV